MDVFGKAAHVYLAITVPENHLCIGQLLFAATAHGFPPIPDHHLFFGQAEGKRGIASQMLVRKEKNQLSLAQRPLQHLFRIGRGADRAAMLADKSFDIRR